MKRTLLVGLAVLFSAGALSAQQQEQEQAHDMASADAAGSPSMPCGEMMKMMKKMHEGGGGMAMQDGGMMKAGGMAGMTGMHSGMKRSPLSPARILHRAEALGLSPEQVSELEEIVNRRNEAETAAVRGLLTPEQLESALGTGGEDSP